MQGKILVIEDADDCGTYLVGALRRLGFDTVGLPYGAGARTRILALHEEGGLRLVIADLTMREPLGLEVLRFLNRYLPDIPVIGLGDPGGATLDALTSLGARAIFRKPLDWDDLVTQIRYTLAEPRLLLSPMPRVAASPDASRPRRRVVLVGEEQDFCEAIAADLERRGHEVAAFLDPRDALAMLLRYPATWDLIVIREGAGIDSSQLRDYLGAVRPELPVIVANGWPNLLNDCRNGHDGSMLSRHILPFFLDGETSLAGAA